VVPFIVIERLMLDPWRLGAAALIADRVSAQGSDVVVRIN
jgi:hypothetical protein